MELMLIFWLVGLNISLGLFLCALDINVRDPTVICTQILWSLNLLLSLQQSIAIGLLYTSPHSALNNSVVQHTAHRLLNCAQVRIPHLHKEWQKIDECLKRTDIYNITTGRIPYVRSTAILGLPPTAFVFTNMDNASIFVTPDYQALDMYGKALILIHECAHIGLGAVDHAYRWQTEYLYLTEKEHYENADSFMDAVLYHCN